MPSNNTTRVPRICVRCGASFSVQPSYLARGAKFCTRDCFSKFQSETKRSRRRPDHPVLSEDQIRAFWSKVRKTDTCWIWSGSVTNMRNPYGRITLSGFLYLSHRISYELHKGSIPEGLVLDHLCRTPRCVNPDHLEAVTVAENNLRGVNGWKRIESHCKHGHLYTPETTAYQSNGTRFCRVCARASFRRWFARKRERETQNQNAN